MYVIEVLISIKLTRTKPFHENRYVKTFKLTALNIFFQHIHKNKRLYFVPFFFISFTSNETQNIFCCMETEGTCAFAMCTLLSKEWQFNAPKR